MATGVVLNGKGFALELSGRVWTPEDDACLRGHTKTRMFRS